MENVDVLIRALEPEIDKKCAEIKKRKSDRVLTRVFISIAAMLLVVPEVLIFRNKRDCHICSVYIYICCILGGITDFNKQRSGNV